MLIVKSFQRWFAKRNNLKKNKQPTPKYPFVMSIIFFNSVDLLGEKMMILRILILFLLLFVCKKEIIAWKLRHCMVVLGKKAQRIKHMVLHVYLNSCGLILFCSFSFLVCVLMEPFQKGWQSLCQLISPVLRLPVFIRGGYDVCTWSSLTIDEVGSLSQSAGHQAAVWLTFEHCWLGPLLKERFRDQSPFISLPFS